MPDSSLGEFLEKLLQTKTGEALLGYLWFMFLACWGGTVSYISRIRRLKRRFRLFDLIVEWAVSCFAGIVTAYFCQHLEFDYFLTAALVALSGHMGGRIILQLERKAQSKLDEIL